MEQKLQQQFENGIRTSTTWQCGDIKIGHAVSVCNGFSSFSGSSNNDVVRLHFGLKGDYKFSYKQLGRAYDLAGSHHNIMYSKGFDIVVENKTLELETFGIQFPPELFIQFTRNAGEPLQAFAESIMAGKNVMLSENWGAISPAIQQVIQQVIHCSYAGELKNLFLLSKSIELLVLCAESYKAANQKELFIKNKSDKEKIIAVRDLVNDRLHCPPNLSEIAKAVGLNEYKLKRGFKETFNTTVFGYLAEQRLHLAHQYLRDTGKTAAEIAADLGYATPQHFNNAFKKKFGFTPYSVRNNP
ncbi:MAG TPA: AraC family transcriptional regulator [Chitinophagaceae bacterium]|nr:AraC family transcriptional regulator [Chitinophagaceae bacterium]